VSYGWSASFEGRLCVEVYDAEGLLVPKDCRYFKGTHGSYPLSRTKCRKPGAGYTHATVEDLSGTKILDSDTARGKCGDEADDLLIVAVAELSLAPQRSRDSVVIPASPGA
jgi:hypothetical protein